MLLVKAHSEPHLKKAKILKKSLPPLNLNLNYFSSFDENSEPLNNGQDNSAFKLNKNASVKLLALPKMREAS